MLKGIQKHKKVSRKNLQKFGFLMATFIGVGLGFIMPIIFHHPTNYFSCIIALFFILTSLIAPNQLIFIYIPWMIIGEIMGYINSKLILGFIYYLIFTPIAFIFRILNKDPLQRKLNSEAKTYRVKREYLDPKQHMERPY